MGRGTMTAIPERPEWWNTVGSSQAAQTLVPGLASLMKKAYWNQKPTYGDNVRAAMDIAPGVGLGAKAVNRGLRAVNKKMVDDVVFDPTRRQAVKQMAEGLRQSPEAAKAAAAALASTATGREFGKLHMRTGMDVRKLAEMGEMPMTRREAAKQAVMLPIAAKTLGIKPIMPKNMMPEEVKRVIPEGEPVNDLRRKIVQGLGLGASELATTAVGRNARWALSPL